MGTADYGQPTDPLSTPSLSQWAEAVHLDSLDTDSEQAAQDARLDVLEAERSLGDLDDVNVTDLPPADGDRLAWSDALGQWQPQPEPPLRSGEWEQVATWAALPMSDNWPGRTVHVLDGLGLCLAVWDGSSWQVDAQSDTRWRTVQPQNGWTATSLQMRRRGATAMWRCYGLSGAGSTAAEIHAIHAGWAPVLMVRRYLAATGSSAAVHVVQFDVNKVLIAVSASTITAARQEESWNTDDPWPTTPPA